MAAYLDNSANPKKIPRNKKLTFVGLALIFNNIFKQITQNKRRRTSVEIIKEDRLTDGIIKNTKAQEIESSFPNPSFLHRKYMPIEVNK